MQKRSKKSWSKLAARITLGLLVACGTLGWAQGASAEGETKFKVTGWTDGKPVCDTSVSGFGQIKYEIKDYEPMLYGKMDWALSNPTDPIFEVYYASTGGDPLKYTDLGKAVLCGSYAKDATYSANNSKVVVTAGKLASVTGGAMSGNGKAENNIVEISGTAAIADSIGGASSFGDANNNKVKINGAVLDINTINGAFLRGENTNGKGNSVLIDSESINAQTISGAKGHLTSNINLTENTLTIKNANLGGYSNTDDIFIEIAGALTSGIRSDGSDSGSAERNTLELDNVTVGVDYILDAYGGFGNKNVEWNYVDIKNSTIENPYSAITGGFAYGGNVKDNTVSIENSTIKGLVYAAMAGSYGAIDVDATATSNKIILKGTLDLKEARLYGVNEQKMAYGKRSNALILDGLTSTNNSTEIRSINYFNYIDFGTVNLTSDNTSEHAYLKLSNDVESKFLDEKTSLYGAISGTGYLMTGYFDGSKLDVSDLRNKFLGGSSVQNYLTGNGVKLIGYDVQIGYDSLKNNNYVKVENGTSPIALAGVYTDGSGIEHKNTSDSTSRAINITSAPASTVKFIAGAYNVATDSAKSKAVNGKATISNIKLDNSTNQLDKQLKLYGGYSINGGAENNQLIINNLSYNANNSLRFYGNYATKGDVKSEITAVEVSGGKVYDIYGNYSNMGGNIIGKENVPVVKLTNVTSCGSITGARIQTSDNSNIYKIENNEVLIQYDAGKSGTGATVKGTEGFSNYIAKNNKVTIDGKFTVNNVRCIDQSKEADGNTVTIRNGAVVNNKVYGVYLGKESASNNKVIINNATVKELVEGASANVKATGNAVEISNGSKVGSVNGFVTGDAENNSISITGSSVTGEVVGHHYKAIATEKNDLVGKKNTIEISNSDVDGNVVGAMIISTDLGSSDSHLAGQLASTLAGTLTENSVTISGNSKVKNATDRYVAGAYINKEYTGVVSGDVVKNTVTIKDSAKVETAIYGGYTVKGNAESNRVTVQDNAQVTGTIYGNLSMDGNATGDSEHANVDIKNGAIVKKDVYGGKADTGAANNNVVNVSGANIKLENASIFGGKGETAEGNKVTVSGGASVSNVWGGSGKGANGNIVTIGTNGDTTTYVGGDVYGASGVGVSGNTVNMAGGLITNGIRGGWDQSGADLGVYASAENNTVNITGGKVRESYISGNEVAGGYSAVKALNNKVNISGGAVNVDVYGNRGGDTASSNGTIKNVNITGGTINGNVYGGAGGIAENNIVSISGGTVTGKYAGVIGGSGTTVSGNKISISGGTVNSKVTGGIGDNYFKYTNELNVDAIINSTVSGNIVEINGGTLGGEQKADIYAGYSESVTSYKKEAVAKGNIKNNKIVITKGEKLDVATSLVNANLYGSNLATSETSGNTLELKDANLNGLKVNTINNFNNIDFGDLIFANNTTLDKAFVTLSMSDASNLVGTVLYADSVNGSGILLTGKFSAKDVTLAGALEATGNKEIVAALDAGGVKVGISTGTTVRFGNDTSSEAIENNYIQLTAGSTTYDKMAGQYINASGTKSGSGTLNLSATPDAAIKTIAGVYSKHPTKEVSGGTLNISGGTYAADVKVFGGYSDGGVVKGNHLNISGGTFNVTEDSNGHIIGGSSIKGTVEGNIIDISGAETVINKWVYGGYGENANKNEVKISNGTLNSVVYGSRVDDGEATENSVQISGGTINSAVYGGYSWHIGDSSTSKANDNEVVISGGTINWYVVGGAGYEAKDNKIIIKQGIDKAASLVNARLEGNSKNTMNATDNNSLIIENLGAGTIIGSVKNFNTISFGDVALGTTSYLTINGGSLNGTVITAGNLSGEGDLISGISTSGVNVEALKGEAGKDKVTALTNGVQYAIAGGTTVDVKPTAIHVKADTPDTVKAVAGVFYGDDGKPEKGNTKGVLTLDVSVTPDEGVIYAGAYAKKGKASGGTVKLTGKFEGTVYGGYSENNGGTENNTLEIVGSNNVTVNKIKAVDIIHVTDKVSKNNESAVLTVTELADFTKANVNIEGLNLEGVTNGDSYKVISNASVDAAKVVIKNLAERDGNVVKANIITKDVKNDKLTLTYGGKVVTGSYTDDAGTVATEDGVLRVSDIGAPEEGVIYTGAYSTKATPNGIVDLDASFTGTLYGGYQATDNKGAGTLNVRGKDLTVNEIANFNTINFFVPAELAKGDTMLKVNSNVNIAGAKVNAGINNKSALDVGDEITLLEAVSLDATGIVAGKVTENDFIDYDMNIETTKKELKAKITSKGISNESSKSPVETIAGGLVMLNMGADQLAGKGFENAAEAVALEKATAPNCMTTFASIGGSKVKAETGSHIDINGWNFNLGFAKEINNKSGKLLIAPLVEYGRGSYDSYIEGAGKTVHADGTSKYWGAGVMARQTNENGFYYEGSLVGGKITNDYSTKDIGKGISYETSAMYITAHLGAGKIVELGEKDKLNFYGKFFYSRLGSDDVTLSNGAKYSFEASESKRMRLGCRWTREVNTMSSLYAGMAWQYEFDAESRATVNGKTAQAPTMKGHTGILELGWKVKPGNSKFDVDLSFLGYTGKHKGGSINVNMNWNF